MECDCFENDDNDKSINKGGFDDKTSNDIIVDKFKILVY